jgi:hypothetical protein
MRVDEPLEELGISTYDRLRGAVEAGDKETALQLIDYLAIEGKGLHDSYSDWVYGLLTWIADNCGEERLFEVFKYSHDINSIAFYAQFKKFKTVKQFVQWFAEQLRAHRSGPGEKGENKIWEEEERYVISADPCGSGGRMRRGGQLDGTPPRDQSPFNFGKTKKAYSWSWGLEGVPYYCLHCSIFHEKMPIEEKGAPVKLAEYDPDPNAPCIFLFYKSPELIPEKYYKRLGLEKPQR